MRSRSHQRRRNRLSKKTQTRRKSRIKSRSKSKSRRRLRLSGGRNRSLAADVATGVGVTAAVGVSAFTAVTAAKKLKQLQEEYVHNFKTGFSALVKSPESLFNDLNINLFEKYLLERRFDECFKFLKRITNRNSAYSIFRKYVWLDKETQDKLISYMTNILITKDWQKIEEYIKKIPNLTVQQRSIFRVELNSMTPGHVLATFNIPLNLNTLLVRHTPDESPAFNNFKKPIIFLSQNLRGEYDQMAIKFNESVRSLLDGLSLTSREELERYLLNDQLALALSQLKGSSNVSGVEEVVNYFYLHSDLIKPQLTQLLYTHLFDIDGQHWLTGLKTQYDYNEFVSRQFQTWFFGNPVSQTITPNNLFFPDSLPLPQPALTLIKTPLLTLNVPVPRNYFTLFQETFLNRLSEPV